ncbi:SDR family oxidoreductase [Streptosporangium sp. NPDC000396]|uniref:SDR family oxidoreductase n=1 Tax=Streptosporangium sp. NPDC000396 TaxID=3366185 RepID=UPI003698067E
MPPFRDLDGKVALVVGGSHGQGAAFAENIASRGATTVIGYSEDDEAAQRRLAMLERHGVTAEASRSDATVSTDVNRLFEGVVSRHSRLDIVVHTPGAVIGKPLADVTDEDFDHVVDHNIRSVFNILRATARHLNDGGRCVVLSATLPSIMTGPYGLYSAFKAAVERMVLAAAQDLAGRGITVNTVECCHHPADVTPIVAQLVGDETGRVLGQAVHTHSTLV